jgi:hypothetical protein
MPLRLAPRRRGAEIKRADALAAEGRYREAIDALTAANRRQPDPLIEERLVRLRIEGSKHIEPSTGLPTWPPTVDDLFPDVVGLPETTRGGLTLEVLQSAILRHGCLLVRGLLDKAQVDRLVDGIDHTFTAFDTVRGTDGAKDSPWFVPCPEYASDDREFARDASGVLCIDSPRGLFDVVETFEETGIGRLVAGFLGEPPMLLGKKWTLRRVPAGFLYADWHQDGSFMGRDIRAMNVWISLSHCGDDAPGLDIIAQRFEDIVQTGTDGAAMDWSVGPGLVEREIPPDDIVHPIFEPGDALLFDHLLLHRTDIRPGTTRPRYAVEAWFAAPSSYPPDQMPIIY